GLPSRLPETALLRSWALGAPAGAGLARAAPVQGRRPGDHFRDVDRQLPLAGAVVVPGLLGEAGGDGEGDELAQHGGFLGLGPWWPARAPARVVAGPWPRQDSCQQPRRPLRKSPRLAAQWKKAS